MIHYIYMSHISVSWRSSAQHSMILKKKIMGRNQGNTLGRYIELDFIGGNMIMCMICATRKYIK